VEHLGLVLLTTFFYGLRHGIDWDHIAAITDISSAASSDERERVKTVGHDLSHAPAIQAVIPDRRTDRRPGWHAFFLSTLYVLGHAAMVALLGSAALLANALLPEWLDPVLERVVGATLLLLAVWVFYSLMQHLRGRAEFRLRSRWMLLFSGIAYLWHRLHERLEGRAHEHQHRLMRYGPLSAFIVGTIHGIGAETGSQVLLIAAVGGAGGPGQGLLLMASFIVGLILSNSVLVIVTTTGLLGAQGYRSAYLAIGSVAGIFSLVVGLYFLTGMAGALPDLPGLFGIPGGALTRSGSP
jgi:hypothetical protein